MEGIFALTIMKLLVWLEFRHDGGRI